MHASDEIKKVADEAARLRKAGQIREACDLVARYCARAPTDPKLYPLAKSYAAYWWEPINGKRCRLRRRSGKDNSFIRSCWQDQDFMHRFNQFARKLPDEELKLKALLDAEYTSLPMETASIHWTIECSADDKPVGILSLVNCSFTQKRAEVLIGMKAFPYPGCAGEAMYLAMEFAVRVAGLDKIYALIYRDNEGVLKNITHLGFEPEGVLRGHVLDPVSGTRIDLVQAGFLASDFAKPGVRKLAARLLGRAIKAA